MLLLSIYNSQVLSRVGDLMREGIEVGLTTPSQGPDRWHCLSLLLCTSIMSHAHLPHDPLGLYGCRRVYRSDCRGARRHPGGMRIGAKASYIQISGQRPP